MYNKILLINLLKIKIISSNKLPYNTKGSKIFKITTSNVLTKIIYFKKCKTMNKNFNINNKCKIQIFLKIVKIVLYLQNIIKVYWKNRIFN